MEMEMKPVLHGRNQLEMDRKRNLEEEGEGEEVKRKKMATATDQIKEEHAYSSRSGAAGRGDDVTENTPDGEMKEEDCDKENDCNYWKKNEKAMENESFGEVGSAELKEKAESASTTDMDMDRVQKLSDYSDTIETGCKASSKAVLNVLVMSRVAKWMPTTDLVQLRETCTLWNKSMVPALRKRHIPANLTFKWPIIVSKTGPCANTRRLLDTLTHSVDIPLGNLNLSLFLKPTKSIVDFPSRLLSRSRWGECLNTLAIVSTSTGSTNPRQDVTLDVTGLRNFIFNDTPMLRKLSMNFGSHDCKEREAQPLRLGQKLSQLKKLEIGGEIRPYVKNLISDIFTTATRLETLNIHNVAGGLFAFQCMRGHPEHLPQLQRLKLDLGTTIETQIHLAKLIKLSQRDINTLKLTKIKTSICIVGKESKQSTADLLVKFLGLQSNCLRKLKIVFTSSDNSQPNPSAVTGLTLPDMNALEVLDIKMPKGKVGKVKHVHLGHYPNLKIVGHDFHSLTTATRNEHMVALSRSPVTEMSQQKFQSIVAMHIFADSFANLKKLSLRLPSAQLELVWTRWPLLEFLEIWLTDKGRALTSKKTMDTILTGIDFLTPAFRESSQIIWEETAGLTRLTQTQDDFRVPRFLKQSPGITDLKFLRVFKMSYHRVKKRTITETNLVTAVVEAGNNLLAQVTDLSGYLAFAAPDSKLQEIRITGGGCNISKKCEETIREAMGPLGVIEFK